MMDQFKSRILGYVEFRTAAIYHADKGILDQIERQFDRFLREVNVTRKEALHEFHLAPLSCRRDMAMLGVIHRAVLGRGPAQVRTFFVPVKGATHLHGRDAMRRHSMQLQTFRNSKYSKSRGDQLWV